MKTDHMKVAIVGCGYTKATRKLEKPETEIAIEACLMAAQDAGMDPSEIDGINVQVHHYPPPETQTIAQGIGITNLRWNQDGGLGILPAGIAARGCYLSLRLCWSGFRPPTFDFPRAWALVRVRVVDDQYH